jgi:hypothetical protein
LVITSSKQSHPVSLRRRLGAAQGATRKIGDNVANTSALLPGNCLGGDQHIVIDR